MQSFVDWIEGPSLVPGWVVHHVDPACEHVPCPDPSRAIIVSIIFHLVGGLLYSLLMRRFAFYRAFARVAKIEWVSYSISTLHCGLVFVGLAYLVEQGLLSGKTLLFARSAIFEAIVCYSIGYFIADLSLMFLPGSFMTIDMLVHHLIAILCFPLIFTFESGMYFCAYALMMELSTPFVNARWFLEKLGLRDSIWYKINGITLVLVFAVIRAGPGQALFVWKLYEYRHELAQLPPALQVVCPLAFGLSTILNMMWFRKIVRGAWKVLKEGGKGRKQGKKLS